MEEKNTHARVSVLETKVSELEKKTENVPRIETLMEMVVTTNEKQTNAIENLNNNITELNNGYREIKDGHEQLNNRMGSIETDLQENRENSTININKLIKRTVFVVIPSLVALAVGIWLGLR